MFFVEYMIFFLNVKLREDPKLPPVNRLKIEVIVMVKWV